MSTHSRIMTISIAVAAGWLVFAPLSVAADDEAVEKADVGSIPIISGGIGEGERDYLSTVQGQYNLKLVFTEGNGVFLADVPVHIEDRQGKTVVDTIAKGPILLMTLPAGTYKISASKEEETKEQTVSLNKDAGGHPRVYQFRFPTRDVVTSE